MNEDRLVGRLLGLGAVLSSSAIGRESGSDFFYTTEAWGRRTCKQGDFGRGHFSDRLSAVLVFWVDFLMHVLYGNYGTGNVEASWID